MIFIREKKEREKFACNGAQNTKLEGDECASI